METRIQYNMLTQQTAANLTAILDKHPDVAGISVGLVKDYVTHGVACGFARKNTGEVMTSNHMMECASLSKTVASAFAIEYFRKKNIPLTASANEVLAMAGSTWRIAPPPAGGSSGSSSITEADCARVTLPMLMNHTALGMHYVYGIPLSHRFPTTLELLDGTHHKQYGYAALYLERLPGTSFKYSGGGYIVLQHIIECFERRPLQEVLAPFLEECGMYDFSFGLVNEPGRLYAYGQLDATKEVAPTDGGRLSFPPFAAGGLCSSQCLAKFLTHLALAYSRPEGSGGISHATAMVMLGEDSLVDLGCRDFMRARMGVGVFVAEAGANRVMLHQAANEGFRGVYMLCFDGPDRGKGFVLLTNGDNPAVYLQCEAARLLLGPKCLDISGIDVESWRSGTSFKMDGLKQEQIVNLGLKELVLAAFQQDGGASATGASSGKKSSSHSPSRL